MIATHLIRIAYDKYLAGEIPASALLEHIPALLDLIDVQAETIERAAKYLKLVEEHL